MRVIVAGDRRNKRISSALDEALQILSPLSETFFVDLGAAKTLKGKDGDIVFVFGGDGSILRTAQLLNGLPIPVVGVNVGRFGFLTEFEMADFRKKAARILEKIPEPSVRTMLKVSFSRRRKTWHILNEAAVVRYGRVHITHLDLFLNGEFVTRYGGDGVLIATPTGSTAYSLSAGGPIVPPDSSVIVVTPLNPHTLTNRPLVLPDHSAVTVKSADERAKLILALDSLINVPLKVGDEITVEKSERYFLLIEKESFFKTLKKKLSWGGVPNYGKG